MKILHITDLHLDNFDGDSELLRKGFYKEYIDRLYNSILNKDSNFQLDCVIITGDFIDRGKTENYIHIETIIKYLAKTFKISTDYIYTSIGNHDYKWKELEIIENKESAHEVESKKDYVEFRNIFNKQITLHENYFTISNVKENIYYISLDCTWNSTSGKPGELQNSEIDHIVNSLRDISSPDTTFLIGCHFPIISFPDNFLAGEETNWHENHVWIKANSLHDRIKRLTTKNIIWFHGDVHAGDARTIENETFILTSKFGCKIDYSEQKRQANLIFIEQDSISKITCNYEFPGHTQNVNLGDWNLSDNNVIRQIKESKQNTENVKEIGLKPINIEVEESIIRKIKENKLYQFGRFKVSDNNISLGWIDISKLLTDKELLCRISDKSYELVTSFNLKNNETIFLGLEIIGGILASQLSVRFNAKNSIIPVRNKKDYYSEFEFSHASSNDLDSIKDIIIFIDLISSGKTIIDIISEIRNKNKKINVHIITIISNDIEGKPNKIPNTKTYNTFCTKLKIPVVNESEMPEEDMFQI